MATVVQKHVGEPMTFRWEFDMTQEETIQGFRLYRSASSSLAPYVRVGYASRAARSLLLAAPPNSSWYDLRAVGLDGSESPPTNVVAVQIVQ